MSAFHKVCDLVRVLGWRNASWLDYGFLLVSVPSFPAPGQLVKHSVTRGALGVTTRHGFPALTPLSGPSKAGWCGGPHARVGFTAGRGSALVGGWYYTRRVPGLTESRSRHTGQSVDRSESHEGDARRRLTDAFCCVLYFGNIECPELKTNEKMPRRDVSWFEKGMTSASRILIHHELMFTSITIPASDQTDPLDLSVQMYRHLYRKCQFPLNVNVRSIIPTREKSLTDIRRSTTGRPSLTGSVERGITTLKSHGKITRETNCRM